jgi:putative nucleotidyltransferase with HDIG domain
VVEIQDHYSYPHQQRVADLARAIAGEMGMSREQLDVVHAAGLIHDIGKIAIPKEILIKPGRLNKMEFALIRTHPVHAYQILKRIPELRPIAEIIYQHHERLDGSGYPRGLKGKDILLEAKIIGVADVVEAMASPRVYRPALGIEAALEEISKNRGLLYDPDVVDACVKLFQKNEFKFRTARPGEVLELLSSASE